MQLQRRLNRKVGDKEYSKWLIGISPEKIEELGWKEGEELTETIEGKKLTLEPETKKRDSKDNANLAHQSMMQKKRSR